MFTGTSILTLVYFFIGWPYLQQRFILQSLGALEQDLVAGLHLAVPLGPGESHGWWQESHLLIHPVCHYGVLPRRNKKKLDRPLPRWILCKYNRNHDQKVQRFLFFTHIYWKYFDYINHVFSKQKFYEIINVGLALFLTLFWMLTYLEESSAGNKLMPASFMIWEIIVNTLVKLNSQLLKVLQIGKKDL